MIRSFIFLCLLGSLAWGQVSLPKNGTPAGWNRKEDPRTYVSNQLWEYMDGGADLYLDHGFRKVHTVEMTKDKKDILIDVYEFGNVDEAFGMYAQERPANAVPLKVGTDGYSHGSGVVFYHGKYYVKITAFAIDVAVKAAMKVMAEAVSKSIRDPRTPPKALSMMPMTGRLPHGEKRIPKNFLGASSFRGAFTADLRVKGRVTTFFLIPFQSGASAATALRNFKSSISSPGKFDKAAESLNYDGLLTGKHSKAGEIILLSKGNWIYGAFPVKNGEATVSMLKNFKF